jgi:hypothetical protein
MFMAGDGSIFLRLWKVVARHRLPRQLQLLPRCRRKHRRRRLQLQLQLRPQQQLPRVQRRGILQRPGPSHRGGSVQRRIRGREDRLIPSLPAVASGQGGRLVRADQ